MNLNLPSLCFAEIFGFSGHDIENILIPLAGIILAGVVVVCAMYFHHRRREMWHQTARLALEKGQPIPPQIPGELRLHLRAETEKNDVRAGLILLGVGAGLFLFLQAVANTRVGYVGAIPGFIGVALLLNGLVTAFSTKKSPTPDDRPPQS